MHIRLLFTLLLLMITGGFANESCFNFFPGSFKVIGGHPAYAVEKDRFVSLACPTGKKIVAHDRFKGLCLFEDHVERPFYLTESRPPLYFCPADTKQRVEILSYPVAIYPGKLSKRYHVEGALFGSCCKLAGIVESDGGWYDTKAVRQLLKGDTHHGDIGIRFNPHDKEIVVDSVDPYAKVSLLPGDKIVSVNGKKSPGYRRVLQAVDRCGAGKVLRIGIERKGKRFVTPLECFERMGGGKISDTFLERFGIVFDGKLRIEEIEREKNAFARGLRRGDRLLMIDGKPVASQRDVRKILTDCAVTKRLPERMLWERAGFQFFLSLGSI